RELERQVDEALREHATVKEEVARLKGAKGDEAGLNDQMSQLEHDVEHHATEEENEMFPRLEELMSAERREDLARQMRALKRRGAATGPRRQTTRKSARPGAKTHGAPSTGSTRAKLTARTKASGRAKATTVARSRSAGRRWWTPCDAEATPPRTEGRWMLRVWGRATSGNVQKVMWTIGELGLPHERIDVGRGFGGLDTAAYGALNPNRR